MARNYYVYILSNKKNGTLYIGVTNDIARRIYEHKNKLVDGFTKKYNLKILVYYEVFEDIENAILREKLLKGWQRNWKISLINEHNLTWKDLYETLNA